MLGVLGHGQCIGQPANDGGLGLFPLLSLPPRLGPAVFSGLVSSLDYHASTKDDDHTYTPLDR